MNRRLRAGAGIAAAAILTWLAFRRIDPAAVSAALTTLDAGWLAGGLAFGFVAHLLRDVRWYVAVRAQAPVAFADVFRVAQHGFLANVALPLRLGDGVRAILMSRVAGIGATRAAMLVAVDRLAELFGLLALLALAAAVLPTLDSVMLPAGAIGNAQPIAISPTALSRATLLLGTAVLCAAAAMWSLARRRPGPSRIAGGRIRELAIGASDALAVLRSARSSAIVFALATAVWLCSAASLGCLLASLGLGDGFAVPIFVQATIGLFVALPIAPGLVGQFHLAVIAGLMLVLPNIPLERAHAAALVVHACALAPVIVLAAAASLHEAIRGASGAGGASSAT